MILSMTGYGRSRQTLAGREITVELKSVNSRYFEYSSRIPRGCAFLDDRLKKLLAGQVSRGKVELSLQVQGGEADTVVVPDLALAKSYQDALGVLGEELQMRCDVPLGLLARFPDVLAVRRAEPDQEQLWQEVSEACQKALEGFTAMRAAEGEKLEADILSRLGFLERAVGEVEQGSAARMENYTRRLYARLKTVLEDRTVDDARVLTEAAVFADKTAVDEETVRLRSHIAQYRGILDEGGPVGRKLDFLTQELNREVNTIGSKCQDIAITRLVVDMKAEIEKIREQVQNIE